MCIRDSPWNYAANQTSIDEFWRKGMERDKNYEQIVTLGMRGVNDTPMSTSANTELLEKIVANQRQILKETVNPDLEKVPQVWALYKEVQGYYDNGMRVPDDVTLLWSDDNWGNLRRLPTAEERKRTGGAGIYYHFDYVGDPRSYKWLNTTSITKVWEQMKMCIRDSRHNRCPVAFHTHEQQRIQRRKHAHPPGARRPERVHFERRAGSAICR